MSAALAERPMRRLETPTPEALCAALNAALARNGGAQTVCSLMIERVRRKPEKIVIGAIGALAGGEAQRFGIRLFAADVAASRYEEALQGDLAPSRCGPGVLLLKELGGVAWLFPNDRKIARLRDLFDPRVLEREILPALGSELADADGPAGYSIEVLRYVPEQGCTVELAWCDARGGERRFIGKCAGDERGAVGFATLRVLETAAPGLTPKAILYAPKHRLFWQQKIGGVGARARDFLGVADGVGAGAMALLSKVHRGDPGGLPTRAAADIVRDLRAAASTPSDGPAADRAARAARALADAPITSISPQALLHGDLHPANFLIDQGVVRLIDFDAACAGPPEFDIGSLFAAIAAAAFIERRDDDALRARLGGLLAIYEKGAGRPLDHAALDWSFRAALLTERFYRGQTRAKPARIVAADRLVAWSEDPAFCEGAGS